eukprot:CAMPEP_0197072376 /NCGR_PEP_ID=MMETSP1384-20130603/210066_1 /TAXON_ID=29189 /ORGANISM="Ammonia sp." /LENGTH=282 /DNA_ID=CAMNT_0042511193 /DNA_START=116 /DNA_END=965 /DNA_ORIENTATION=+
MGDDMKDMMPNFLGDMNNMMDMDMLNQSAVKQENHHNHNHSQNMPPDLGSHHPHTIYPVFSSASPPQQSPMFMDTINGHSIYPSGDYNNSTYAANGLIRSASMQIGPNTSRPSNLPPLRRTNSSTVPTSNHSDNNSNNNNSSSNSNNNNSSSNHANSAQHAKPEGRGNAASVSNHVLTPFDHPLTNPIITAATPARAQTEQAQRVIIRSAEQPKGLTISCGGIQRSNLELIITAANSSSSSDGASTASHHSFGGATKRPYNFLWWYPEIKFGVLDPEAVPIK